MAESGLSPVLATGAVVVSDGRLLMVRRGREPGAGLWSLPGGRVEAGETLREAVEREVHEETHLRVRATRLLGWVERRGEGWHFVICDFSAELDSVADAPRDPAAGDDAAEAAFVPLERVRELPLVDGLGDWLVDHGVLRAAAV